MKLKDQEFYLVKLKVQYCESGYTIAKYQEGVFFCDLTGNDLTEFNPKVIKHLI